MPQDPTIKLAGDALQLSDHAMAQLYRGELGRSDRWRTRLDTTTNWALTTTAAAVSYGFSNPNSPHVVMLIGLWMASTFLLIEARRYRYYDLWIRRVRLIEDGYWAPMLRREPVDPDAIKELAMEMSRPQIRLSLFSAVATRMNRAYGPILLVLFLSWFVKLYLQPSPAFSLAQFAGRGHVGPVPGSVILAAMALSFVGAVMVVIASVLTRPPLGELQPRARSRKRVMWEVFGRPYEMKQPRRHAARRPSTGSHTH